ncbi:unnamed protein product [Linum tenue]|uniref:Uncharacterized protein n=1 Tax=Linum tenue TaxID=586396 RepID=A0AAV0I3X0_9ROSI|nr:unnamed protein product [Linum tenue]
MATKSAQQVGVKKPRRFSGAEEDPQVQKEHRVADPQASVPEVGVRNRQGFQDGSEVSEQHNNKTNITVHFESI